MEKISNFFYKLNHIMLGICGVCVAAATALAAVNSVLRFTIRTSFGFADELCVYFVAVMVFIAMSNLEFTNSQLTIDIFDSFVKNKIVKKIVLYIRGIITAVFYFMLIYYGMSVTKTAFVRHTVTNVMQIPRCVIYGVVTVSLIVAFASWVVLLVCRKGEFVEC